MSRSPAFATVSSTSTVLLSTTMPMPIIHGCCSSHPHHSYCSFLQLLPIQDWHSSSSSKLMTFFCTFSAHFMLRGYHMEYSHVKVGRRAHVIEDKTSDISFVSFGVFCTVLEFCFSFRSSLEHSYVPHFGKAEYGANYL